MKHTLLLTLLFLNILSNAQNCGQSGQPDLKEHVSISSACNEMTMTMVEDVLGRHILYVANKEAGLKCYNVVNPDTAILIKQIKITGSDNGDVMSLTQSGNFIYLAVGNHFSSGNKAGLAIVDVSDIDSIKLINKYFLTGSNTGAGAIAVEGNYAYLGAMGSGLAILDVSDKSNLSLKSVFAPDINFPVKNPNASKYNARGLVVQNDIVYLCYDAGGIRIINCSNKNAPIETGRFANPLLYSPVNLPRAYNNLVLDDTLVYVAVDYCGMEVLDIRDTANVKLIGWWNPKNCPNNNWFTSPVHANEIQLDKNMQKVYISTGKSDMVALNIENPTAPDSCSAFGGNGNGIGTWGVHQRQNRLYLSYICTVGIPFSSNWTGVKVIELNYHVNVKALEKNKLSVYPNPSHSVVKVSCSDYLINPEIRLYNQMGELVKESTAYSGEVISLNVSEFTSGVYFLTISDNGKNYSTSLIIQ